MLLYEIEYKYQEALDNAIDIIRSGCSLKEFLELGFNNATLLNPFEEDTDAYDICDLYYNSDMANELDEKMLNCDVELSSTYEDGDGFTCATICLSNEDDWKYFKKLGGK